MIAGLLSKLAATAASDSLTAAAVGHSLAEFQDFIDHWHDFFLLTGTAAATLAGLLFIALSLHMEVLVRPKFSGMLVVARSALTSFVTVLIVSMMMLPPGLSPRSSGFSLIAFVGVFTVISLFDLRKALEHEHQDFPRRTVRRRVLMPIVGYAFLMFIGVSLFRHVYEAMYLMISAMSLLLANAAFASWDLLVRVSKVKAGLRPDEPVG